MSAIVLIKGQTGHLEGVDEKASRVYARFLAKIKALLPGQTIGFTYKVPRAPKFHRLHFVMLKALFDNQEQFQSEYQFRKWTEVGAGHCDMLPGPKGKPVAIPRSIDYESLDDEEFSEVHKNVKTFLRSIYAARFLWPDVAPEQAAAGVEAILEEFER